MSSAGFVVVLPVKPPAHGKSRLALPDAGLRRDLAAAFAVDTAAACLAARAVGRVLAVTDDAGFAARLRSVGCDTIPDGTTAGLNASLVQAAAEAGRRAPGLRPVAVCADLPALRAADLEAALDGVRDDGAWFVADATGVGTSLYTAPTDAFDPAFGADSAAAHRIGGALPLRGELATLRRDVDDLDDLRAALALGVGPATRELVAQHGAALLG